MPAVKHVAREIHLKIVYYGPGLGGKTTNLRCVHANTRPDARGKLLSLDTEAERTLFFDLLALHLGKYKGYAVRLHLCTVPGQIAHDETRRLVLKSVDGVVFVVDSQRAMLDSNVESIRNLEDNLRLQGDDPDVLPLVVQYNKRDLADVSTVEELHDALRVPAGVPELEAVALEGTGVFETLKAIVKQCLQLVPDPASMREGRTPSILPGRRASMYPDAPVPAPVVPAAPRVPSFDPPPED
jgi:hypothetical protein